MNGNCGSQNNVYIGARYVPRILGEWSADITYEPLDVVLYQGTSYTSRTYVPKGIIPGESTQEYWALTGNYNAQVEMYRQEVEKYKNDVDNLKPYISKTYTTTLKLIEDTPKIGTFVETLGYKTINDGGNSLFYITDVIDETKFQLKIGNLYATIIGDKLNTLQIGCDEINDCTSKIQEIINKYNYIELSPIIHNISGLQVPSYCIIKGSIDTFSPGKMAILKALSNNTTLITLNGNGINISNLLLAGMSQTNLAKIGITSSVNVYHCFFDKIMFQFISDAFTFNKSFWNNNIGKFYFRHVEKCMTFSTNGNTSNSIDSLLFENVGQAINANNLIYSNINVIACDYANYNIPTNPYGFGFGNVNQPCFNFILCNGLNINSFGCENNYGSYYIYMQSGTININEFHGFGFNGSDINSSALFGFADAPIQFTNSGFLFNNLQNAKHIDAPFTEVSSLNKKMIFFNTQMTYTPRTAFVSIRNGISNNTIYQSIKTLSNANGTSKKINLNVTSSPSGWTPLNIQGTLTFYSPRVSQVECYEFDVIGILYDNQIVSNIKVQKIDGSSRTDVSSEFTFSNKKITFECKNSVLTDYIIEYSYVTSNMVEVTTE